MWSLIDLRKHDSKFGVFLQEITCGGLLEKSFNFWTVHHEAFITAGSVFINVVVSLIGKLPRCLRERQFALGWHDIAVPRLFAPECTTDGKYELVQCHPSSGFCWCSDKDGHVYSGTKVRGKPDCSNLPGRLPVDCWFSSFSVNSISLLLPIKSSTLQASLC